VGTIWVWAKPVSGSATSFLFRISNTLRWLLEWISLQKVGLHAGLYSENNRPDLYRTPHALQRVLAPSGPVLHCGVFCTWQWLHRRWIWTPTGWTWASARFFCFFAGGEDGSESNVLPNDHTRVLGFLFRTLLALLVIFISHGKRGVFFTEGSGSTNRFASSERTGYKSDSSGSESSTKCETHSRSSKSPAYTNFSYQKTKLEIEIGTNGERVTGTANSVEKSES